MLDKAKRRLRRQAKIRSTISGSATSPRLSVFRSNANIYAQLIDDDKGVTLVSSSDLLIKEWTKVEKANKVGEEIAKKAIDLKIKTIKFDRGGFSYQGRVKALADAARQAGLEF